MLSVGWPDVRPPGWMAFPWSSILSFGPFWVLILSLFSTPLSILAVSLSQRRGVISLSFKKGDRLDPRNWRPITLLNVDYKLASRTIIGWLLKVIHLLVAEDQTCGVPGHFIGENMALLRDVVTFPSSSRAPVAILFLDQEKVFDRVDWGFMRSTLVAMGFGLSFVAWVDLFYRRVQSSVNVNGYVSAFFNLSRGVRQGCPLSSLLYVLVSEVLVAKIRCNTRISGLHIPGFPPLSPILQYADDKSYRSLQCLFRMINVYEGGSGARLNVTKTEAMWLGAWRSRGDQPLGLKWVTKMKILGVVFGQDTETDNWRPKLEKLEKHLNLWKSRSLSLVGKSLIINVLGISKLLYLSAVLCVPKWVISKVNNLVWPFLWGSRIETVSRMTCHQSLGKGGLGIFNFQTKSDSLKLASLICNLEDRESKSFFLTKYFLGSRLASCRPEWRSLRDNSTPSAQNLTPYYEKCFSVLTTLRRIVSTTCIYCL